MGARGATARAESSRGARPHAVARDARAGRSARVVPQRARHGGDGGARPARRPRWNDRARDALAGRGGHGHHRRGRRARRRARRASRARAQAVLGVRDARGRDVVAHHPVRRLRGREPLPTAGASRSCWRGASRSSRCLPRNDERAVGVILRRACTPGELVGSWFRGRATVGVDETLTLAPTPPRALSEKLRAAYSWILEDAIHAASADLRFGPPTTVGEGDLRIELTTGPGWSSFLLLPLLNLVVCCAGCSSWARRGAARPASRPSWPSSRGTHATRCTEGSSGAIPSSRTPTCSARRCSAELVAARVARGTSTSPGAAGSPSA